jgi:uncharacterized protein (TIGR02266 family)
MSESESPGYDAEQKNMRINTRSPLIVEKIPIDDGYKTLFGYAKNVSRGGLFIATVKPREPGETFTVEFSLPLDPPHRIRCQCKVVWKRLFQKKDQYEPGMGLCFVGLDSADGDKIEEWVDGQVEQLSG